MKSYFDKNSKYTLIITIIILFSSASLILLNYYSIKVLSSIRAYVNSESQYSKAQKNATGSFTSYINSPDDYYFNSFTTELAVPIGDSIARVAMQHNKIYGVAENGFKQARNHPDDIQNMYWLFINFQHLPYFREAIKEWSTSDLYIGQLNEIGNNAYSKFQNSSLSYEERQRWLRRIDDINSRLTYHQQQFSNILGEASRLLTGLLIYINMFFILLILVSAGLFSRKLIKQLLESGRQIEQQNHAKDEFMSIASHELKTPITTMKASLQILERFAERSAEFHKVHPFIINSNKQVKRLTELVNELLDVTKIHSGKLSLHKKMFSLTEVITDTVGEISSLSAHHFIIKDVAEIYIHADQNRIRQVLVNLLTNAAKYSKSGSDIIVWVEIQPKNVKVSVKDYGSGIAKEKIPLLFERFYRIEQTENTVQGLGLGLFISSEIIKNHNGEIGAESEVGYGSTFWFSLPKV